MRKPHRWRSAYGVLATSSTSSRRATLSHLLLVTLLGLPLVTPLLRWSSVPCTHDGHLHYHRVAALRHAWENGLFFSRWLPDLAFGYGYPFFLYREPLPLYLSGLLHAAGLPLPAATNLLYALGILTAGWFTYLWVRDIFGARAGIVAAVAYMAAPYQLADALVRGNQVESVALALFPLLLWSGRRFVLRGTAGWFLLASGGLVALALSHNISLLIFTPSLLLYLLVTGWVHRLSFRPLLLRLLLLFGLGLGLTAFYTAPAVLELDQVPLSLSTTTRHNDFRYNFASLTEILAPVAAEDPQLLNPPLLFRLGWVPVGLALLGLLSLRWRDNREQRAILLLMALAAAIYLLLALPPSRPVWEALPLIEFVQFPWRLVGRAALPAALLAGAAMGPWPSIRLRWRGLPAVFTSLALLLLVLEAVPLLYPAMCPEEPFPTILTVHHYERETGLVGVDPEGSYFPKTVLSRPDASPLETDYVAGRPPQRFDEQALPAGATLLQAAYGPLTAEITLQTPQPFQARYLTFAFPGWVVTVNGERVPVQPEAPSGLMTFQVPAGQHTIRVTWGSTPLRTLFLAVSGLSLVGLLIASVLLCRQRPALPEPIDRPDQTTISVPLIAFLALLLLAGKLLLFDRLETPLRHTVVTPPVAFQNGLTAGLTGPELRLTGYNLSRAVVPAGETFDVDLAWQTLQTPTGRYQSNLWLAGTDGLIWSDQETHRPRVYEDAPATLFWQPGQWAWDSREVQVLPGTPPGRYDLVLTYFPLDTLQPLTLTSADGATLGPMAVIGQVEVTRPDTPPTFTPQFPLDTATGGLRLLGYNQDRQEAAPGDPLLLTLFWEKTAEMTPADTVRLALQDASATTARSWSLPPVQESYPPTNWQVGERLRGQHLLTLPAGLESGTYTLVLEDVTLGQVQVMAPTRLFTPPPFAIPVVDGTFAGQLALVGYTLSCAEQACQLNLVWQGMAEMSVSYHIFVHLLDENGQLVAQADGQPAGWARPTTGWAAGEFILDEHGLTWPEGEPGEAWQLRVGVYDPGTGERLQAAAGAAFVILPLAAP